MLLLLLLLAGLSIWLATGQRSVPSLMKWIERRIDAAAAPYHLSADRLMAEMIYDKGLRIDLIWSNARIGDGSDRTVATFPTITTRLGLGSLFSAQLHLDGILLDHARLVLTARKDGRLALGLKPAPDAAPGNRTLPIADLLSAGHRLGSVIVQDSDIVISAEGGGEQVLHSPESRLGFDNDTLSLDIRLGNGKKEAHLAARLSHEGMRWKGNASLSRVDTETLLQFLPNLASWQGLHLPLDADATMTLDKDFRLIDLQASMKSDAGSFENKTIFPEKLAIRSVDLPLLGKRDNGIFTLSFDQARIAGDLATLDLGGTVAWREDGAAIDLLAHTSGIKLDDLPKIWPLTFAAHSRQWVTTHISGGMLSQASCAIHLVPGDLDHPHLPEKAIDARISLTGASLDYLPNMPRATDIDAMVEITGKSLKTELKSGKSFTTTVVNKGTVTLPDFANPAVPLHVTLDVAAPASDVAEALSERHLKIGPQLQLDPATIGGRAVALLDFDIVLFPEATGPVRDTHSTVDYAVDAQLQGITQKKMLAKWDVDGLTGHFLAHSGSLSLDAKTSLQGVPGTLTVALQDEPGRIDYGWTAPSLPLTKLSAFGPEPPSGVTGTLGLEAQVTESGDEHRLDAKVDLTATAIQSSGLRYTKAAGVPGSLTLRYLDKAGVPGGTVPAFTYRTRDDDVHGSLRFATASRIVNADLPDARLGATQLSFRYADETTGKHVGLTGKRLDLTPLWQGRNRNASASEASDPLAILDTLDFTVDLGEIRLGENEAIEDVSGTLTCGPKVCSHGMLNAKTEAGRPISYRLSDTGGVRHLAIQTGDGGDLMRIFGISRNIAGGDLTVEGSFDDAAPHRPLNAHVLLERFRVHDAPAMTKLLSLVSPTGFADTVSGQGIGFDRLSGDIVYSKGDLLLKNVRAVGPALGVMVEGAIDDGDRLALSGTLVPSYTANSLLGKIPLLGNLLVGGEGEGIIAARFSVKGSVENPDVSVNPLSLLTPGFLRNLFSIGDDTPEQAAARLERKKQNQLERELRENNDGKGAGVNASPKATD